MDRVCRAAAWTVLAVLQVSLAYGQTTATLRGQVRDAQGAAVPSATVVVSSQATGLSRTVPTASDGSFVVANLPPSVVDLTVSATGFAEAKRAGLALEVGQTAAVEIELTVAGVRERVDVPVTVTGVDTTRSVVDAVIPSTAIEALPLNGRNFLQLALLVPGNAPAPNFDPTKSNSVVISSAGQLGRGGNITIDGADNNDDVVGGPLQNVTQESVQEFQIATNRFTAESGRSASSVINVVTKSGSDRLRGSVSLFARDHRWQGLPATFDRSSGDTLPFDRQQVAGAAGGPLVSGKAVLVRRGRVPQSGRRRARRRARRGGPHDSTDVRAGPPRRPARIGTRGLASEQRRHAHGPLRRRAGHRHGREQPRPGDRIGVAAPAQPQHLPLDRRHLDARAQPERC